MRSADFDLLLDTIFGALWEISQSPEKKVGRLLLARLDGLADDQQFEHRQRLKCDILVFRAFAASEAEDHAAAIQHSLQGLALAQVGSTHHFEFTFNIVRARFVLGEFETANALIREATNDVSRLKDKRDQLLSLLHVAADLADHDALTPATFAVLRPLWDEYGSLAGISAVDRAASARDQLKQMIDFLYQ